MDAESLVRPVVEAEGLELVEVALTREAGRRLLRVTVDRPDGLDLDTVSQLSLKLSRQLDDEDFGAGPYALEVSSPGIERPLRNPGHFARAVGGQVRVTTIAAAQEPSAVHTGALSAADDEGIELLVEGRTLRLAYGEIVSATTVVDWAAELKGNHT
jgi:ribosome maturation factor RimP